MSRFRAYLLVALSVSIGGGSCLLFGTFLVGGAFDAIRLDFSEPQRLLWDGMLSLTFFAQHSGMVRRTFRARLSSVIPADCFPAIYSIASGIALIAVVALWQPSGTVLFALRGWAGLPIHALFVLSIVGMGWGILVIRQIDPFGQADVMARLAGKAAQAPRLSIRGPYLWVRHPLYFFMLVMIWATPELSADRLLFNLLWSSWIFLGSHWEEKDLVAEFGDEYRDYQGRVPMLIPWKGLVGKVN